MESDADSERESEKGSKAGDGGAKQQKDKKAKGKALQEGVAGF